jgi:hypothetical protein
MEYSYQSTIRNWSAAVGIVAMIASAAGAVVLHSDFQPADHPANVILGRWGTNASCVVIAPNYILTTRHQGGGVGTSLQIGSVACKAAEIFDNPDADLRVVRISTAVGGPVNLTQYAGLYTTFDEVGLPIVFGGYGKGRGASLYTPGGAMYGYSWTGTDNSTLRWGSNTVSGTGASGLMGGLTFTLTADFGGPETGEASLAEYDSGGGWFASIAGQWKLLALSETAEHADQSWFRNAVTGASDPDSLGAVRVSSYASWINNTAKFNPILTGDTNWDGTVNIVDMGVFATNYGKSVGMSWNTGDFSGDGIVNVTDLGLMACNYGKSSTSVGGVKTASALVPEPGLLLLLLPAAVVFRRKNRR